MLRTEVPALISPLLLSTFLIAIASTPPLHAQVPASATVVVRMIDAIDSSKDPAGKQYRASVAKAVDAGNGVIIPQGAVAAVTLANSGNGSGWTTQLVSVTVNGQPVAVTTGPASVTAAAQSAAAGALSSMNSVLGGFGRHVNAPAAATAVSTGQRVVLPPGVTLNFVLSQPPAANQTASSPASSVPVANSKECAYHSTCAAALAPSAAASAPSAPAPSASAALRPFYTLCRYQGQQGGIIYVAPIIHWSSSASDISVAFNRYMSANYDLLAIQAGSGYCETVSDSADQQAYTMQQLEKQWADSKTVVTHINWTATPAEIADTNAKLAARAANPPPAKPHVCRPGDRNPVCAH